MDLLEGDSCKRQQRGWRRTSKDVLSRRIVSKASPQLVIDYLRLLFTKGTQRVCGGVEGIGRGFQQWRRVGGTPPAQLLMQSLD